MPLLMEFNVLWLCEQKQGAEERESKPCSSQRDPVLCYSYHSLHTYHPIHTSFSFSFFVMDTHTTSGIIALYPSKMHNWCSLIIVMWGCTVEEQWPLVLWLWSTTKLGGMWSHHKLFSCWSSWPKAGKGRAEGGKSDKTVWYRWPSKSVCYGFSSLTVVPRPHFASVWNIKEGFEMLCHAGPLWNPRRHLTVKAFVQLDVTRKYLVENPSSGQIP